MRTWLIFSLVVMTGLGGVAQAADGDLVRPFESDKAFVPTGRLDELVLETLNANGAEPAYLCSDEVFVRRVYLDMLGTLPEADEIEQFLALEDPRKRERLVDALFGREAFADYWSLKWCDLLRVKAEFPINLWPNAVQAYHRWIRGAVADNRPYDEFARALLTSSGSNFRVPPVNFYRAMQGHEPATIASAVALTLMGTRLEGWPEDRREGMITLFSRVAFKGTAEWKEEIVYLDPAPAPSFAAMLPDGTIVQVAAGEDPRRVFADWLITPENPWFTRNIVNRIWSWLMGRGIIHQPDDVRPDNPPVNEALLAYLQRELIEADYDLRHVYRLILTSRTYQQSCIPRGDASEAERLFAVYPVRRLDAEVLIDALCWIGGTHERYISLIPEPFTFIPEHHRTIMLADGSITSQFLEMFGRPPRDTGLESERSNEPTKAQRLHLLNSSHIQKKITRSPRMRTLLRRAGRNPDETIRAIYITILSRYPAPVELARARAYFKADGVNRRRAAADLAWALINTKEFLYRH